MLGLMVVDMASSNALCYNAGNDEIYRRCHKANNAERNQPFSFAHLRTSIQYF